jgi:hypothetical protein
MLTTPWMRAPPDRLELEEDLSRDKCDQGADADRFIQN